MTSLFNFLNRIFFVSTELRVMDVWIQSVINCCYLVYKPKCYIMKNGI